MGRIAWNQKQVPLGMIAEHKRLRQQPLRHVLIIMAMNNTDGNKLGGGRATV